MVSGTGFSVLGLSYMETYRARRRKVSLRVSINVSAALRFGLLQGFYIYIYIYVYIYIYIIVQGLVEAVGSYHHRFPMYEPMVYGHVLSAVGLRKGFYQFSAWETARVLQQFYDGLGFRVSVILRLKVPF